MHIKYLSCSCTHTPQAEKNRGPLCSEARSSRPPESTSLFQLHSHGQAVLKQSGKQQQQRSSGAQVKLRSEIQKVFDLQKVMQSSKSAQVPRTRSFTCNAQYGSVCGAVVWFWKPLQTSCIGTPGFGDRPESCRSGEAAASSGALVLVPSAQPLLANEAKSS